MNPIEEFAKRGQNAQKAVDEIIAKHNEAAREPTRAEATETLRELNLATAITVLDRNHLARREFEDMVTVLRWFAKPMYKSESARNMLDELGLSHQAPAPETAPEPDAAKAPAPS